MVLDPDRVLFQTLVAVELEMIMVVIGVAVVFVYGILAEQVIGDRVAALAILGHSNLLPAAPQRSHVPRAHAPCVIAWRVCDGQSASHWRLRAAAPRPASA